MSPTHRRRPPRPGETQQAPGLRLVEVSSLTDRRGTSHSAGPVLPNSSASWNTTSAKTAHRSAPRPAHTTWPACATWPSPSCGWPGRPASPPPSVTTPGGPAGPSRRSRGAKCLPAAGAGGRTRTLARQGRLAPGLLVALAGLVPPCGAPAPPADQHRDPAGSHWRYACLVCCWSWSSGPRPYVGEFDGRATACGACVRGDLLGRLHHHRDGP